MKLLVITVLAICCFCFGYCQRICKGPHFKGDIFGGWGWWGPCTTPCGNYGYRNRYRVNYDLENRKFVKCRERQTEPCITDFVALLHVRLHGVHVKTLASKKG